jgi:hypothetical protein
MQDVSLGIGRMLLPGFITEDCKPKLRVQLPATSWLAAEVYRRNVWTCCARATTDEAGDLSFSAKCLMFQC